MVIQTESLPTISRKSLLSQFIAMSPQNFLLIDIALGVTLPSAVIPSLLGSNESLYFTAEQASLFGALGLILQPIGSIISGFTIEPLGRKKCFILVNLPHVIAWTLLYFSTNIVMVFLGISIIGIGIGFMEAPLMTYVGEISHPSLRGMLSSYGQVFIQVGFLLGSFMMKYLGWRTYCLIAISIPVLGFFSVFLIPESPIWLVSKGRMDDAMKSLCWVRGWCQPEEVKKEFDDIVAFYEKSIKCIECSKLDSKTDSCTHRRTSIRKKIKGFYEDMTRKEMLRPLSLVIFTFAITHFNGLTSLRPNIVKYLESFGIPIDPYLASIIMTAISFIAVILLVIVIKFTGKRKIVFIVLIILIICNLLLGLYAYKTLPEGFTTYVADVGNHVNEYSWYPSLLFIVFTTAANFGIMNIPWILAAEVFPLRCRGIACGFSASLSYLFAGLATKTNLDLEKSLGVHGTFWFYSAFCVLGLIVLYLFMHETEGKTAEEIAEFFNGETLKIAADDRFTEKLMSCLRSNSKNDTDLDVDDCDKNVSTRF